MSDFDGADIQISYAEPVFGKCPVCGTAGGNCKGETGYHGSVNIIAKKENDPRATFRVPRRVYKEVEVNGRKVSQLLYAVGAAITPEEAKRLGFLPDENRLHHR